MSRMSQSFCEVVQNGSNALVNSIIFERRFSDVSRHAILRGMSGAVLRFCILRFLLGKQFFEDASCGLPAGDRGANPHEAVF